MSNTAEKIEQTNIVPMSGGSALTPMDMLDRAVAGGASIEVIEKLMALKERYDANEARKAFADAMSKAKAELPVIVKNRTVGFESKKTNERTSYQHADFAQVARTVDPILTKQGLSYRFRTESISGQASVSVTCIVEHAAGHSEETTLVAERDTSGSKNAIQAIGSTVTYLQRYTLMAALGLAAASDDDGKTIEASATISEAQMTELRDLIEAVGADVQRTCAVFKIDGLALLPAGRFEEAKTRLKKFGEAAQKQGAK